MLYVVYEGLFGVQVGLRLVTTQKLDLKGIHPQKYANTVQ